MKCDGFKDCFTCPLPDCERLSKDLHGVVTVRPAKKKRKVWRISPNGDKVLFDTAGEGARLSGVDPGGVHRCLKGKHHHAGGYRWTYA